MANVTVDAWRLTSASASDLPLTVYAEMEAFWRTNNRLPHQPTVGPSTTFDEDHRAWFEMCVESMLLPERLDKLRAVRHGRKCVREVDFNMYHENQSWLATARIAMTLMAAAEHLEQAFSRGGEEFGAEYSHREALQGEARTAWKSQGPASGMGACERLDPARERGWYWAVRDCFTAISQRIAAGTDPHPMTYAELWAWCLVFEEAEGFIQDELHMNDELCAQYNALPTHEVTRLGFKLTWPFPCKPESRDFLGQLSPRLASLAYSSSSYCFGQLGLYPTRDRAMTTWQSRELPS
jgi:hypothetical protein